jgi:hypothetical protein
MADAVIFDDGGSTRIKRVKNGVLGAMDSLLDVDDLGNGTRGADFKINDSFNHLLIVVQDTNGKPFEIQDSSFATVEISSALSQEISAVKNAAATSLTLTVFSSVSEPIVESKQHNKKRRYVVSNSGPIEKIKVDGTVVFNVRKNEPEVKPALAVTPIIYTSVVLT